MSKTEVRERVLGILSGMREVGATIHPYVSDEFYRLAELLGIPETELFTEGDELRSAYGKTDEQRRDARLAALQRLAEKDGFVIVPFVTSFCATVQTTQARG